VPSPYRRGVLSVVVGAAVTIVVVVVAARTGPSGDRVDGAPSAGPARSAEPGPGAPAPSADDPGIPGMGRATTATRARRGSGRPVVLVFGGDVHFEGHLRPALARDPAGLLAPIAGELSSGDVAMVNLETAVTTRGVPEPKAYTFRAPPEALAALAAAGVDVVTVANNHGVDYGPVGLADTIVALGGAPLGAVGIGSDDTAAYRPWRVRVHGQRVAVFGASDVIDDPLVEAWSAGPGRAGIATVKGDRLARLLAAVREERTRADTIVVYLHWGVERETCPSGRQQELARAFVTAGADVVVGSHTHRVMGAGRLDGALVAYGLGNFVFYNEAGANGESGVLRVTVTGRDVEGYEWRPARIQGGVPHPVPEPAATAARQVWEGRRACTGLRP